MRVSLASSTSSLRGLRFALSLSAGEFSSAGPASAASARELAVEGFQMRNHRGRSGGMVDRARDLVDVERSLADAGPLVDERIGHFAAVEDQLLPDALIRARETQMVANLLGREPGCDADRGAGPRCGDSRRPRVH